MDFDGLEWIGMDKERIVMDLEWIGMDKEMIGMDFNRLEQI